MVDIVRRDANSVWIKVRIPQSDFVRLVELFGSEGKSLGAIRQAMPHFLLDVAEVEARTVRPQRR